MTTIRPSPYLPSAGGASPHAAHFLTPDPSSDERLGALASAAVGALSRATGPGPRSALDPDALAALVADLDVCPARGLAPQAVLDDLADRVLAHGVRPADPACAAHLHPPALLAAAVSELLVGATNQSLDSHDQAPAATALELHLVAWLATTLGLPPGASGVLTAGGTASNLLGLTLARDRAARAVGADVAAEGLPPEARRWRILASAGAHFSVAQAAAVLGLGHRAVVPVAVDAAGRLDPGALDRELDRLAAAGDVPLALVGTAGTTDLGAVDPLAALADRAAAVGAWFHVDAAVGAALALSDRHRPLLAGLGRADSVTADLHKLWWQPIGASALLVRDPASFAAVRRASDYLDRDDDVAAGVVNLVGRSLDTSRRFDALKVVASLRITGRDRMAAMVDHVVALAAAAADAVRARPDLTLVAEPTTVTCVFRWHPTDAPTPPSWHRSGAEAARERRRVADEVMVATGRRLFASGRAVVGRTRVDGEVALKLTFVNPVATEADARALIRLVADEATAVAYALRATAAGEATA